ncbi:MAG: arginine--tRNA ligase [Alphaproteobacteria bacterium]|nr:arginine--tRNA ligase [Alphaproteobacteria bacterium]
MNFFEIIKNEIAASLANLCNEGKLPQDINASKIAVEPPRDTSHGDVATNAAMVLAKQAGMPSRDIATLISEKLQSNDAFEKVEIAGPGFINIRLSNDFWHNRLKEILTKESDFGSSDIGKGTKVNVEYVSANPTGPMHVGHGRGAVFGDVLSSLLAKAGFDVSKEFYINDAGSQIDVLAQSTYIRYLQALGENTEIPEGCYPGDYLIPVGKAIADADGDKWKNANETEWLVYFREYSVNAMMDLIKEDLAALGIKHDVFSSEKDLVDNGMVGLSLENLKERGLIYEGVLEPPKGKKPDDWEPRPQTLFKATDFGDDIDRPLKKSDGSWTYFASDIAYHHDKFERGFGEMIDIWGADHGGYVKRMKSAVKAITEEKGNLDVKLCQMVNLLENGKPFKMSKRAGTFVTLRDVIDAVGKDVMRFIMLTRKNDAQLDFDLKKVKEQSKDNPVFYVQYAHARIHSVLRHAAEMFNGENITPKTLADADLSKLNDETELSIIKVLAQFPRQIETAAEMHEPHRLAYYLHDVAAAFHGLWNKGKDNADLRFLIEKDKDASIARLALVSAVAIVISSGLEIFGVEPVEEM